MNDTTVGRMARCSCGRTEPSDPELLAFFEYLGEGSRMATEQCKCGYYKCAHERQPQHVDPRSVIELGKCNGFEARGPQEYDRFYCGCRGWD